MIKVSRLLRRQRHIDAAAFEAHWAQAHALQMQRLMQTVPAVLRYAQSYPLATEIVFGAATDDPIDCIEELWCESFDAAIAVFDAEAYRAEIEPAERSVRDAAASEVVAGVVHRVLDRSVHTGDGAVKMMLLGVRRPSLSAQQFRRYWLDVHSKIALGSPTLQQPHGGPRRVEFCPGMGLGVGGLPVSGHDAIVSVWFDRLEDLQHEFGGDYYREQLQPDEPNFSDLTKSRGVLTREAVVWEAA